MHAHLKKKIYPQAAFEEENRESFIIPWCLPELIAQDPEGSGYCTLHMFHKTSYGCLEARLGGIVHHVDLGKIAVVAGRLPLVLDIS